jgi:N-dimethylarginine dimethylaminohydrolase
MDDHAVLSQLEGLANTLGIQIRYEKIIEDELSGAGGLCRVKGEWVIIVNSRATINEKIQTLAKSLKNFDLNNIYIRPALRELLEK